MRLFEKVRNLLVQGKLTLGKNASLVINSGATEKEVDLNELINTLDNTSRVEVLSAAKTLTAADSGKTFMLALAAGFAVTLPAPALGLNFKFVVSTAPTDGDYTIASNGGDNIIVIGVNELDVDTGNNGPYDDNADLVTLVEDVAVKGDFVDVYACDGTSWYARGQTNADGGITTSTT